MKAILLVILLVGSVVAAGHAMSTSTTPTTCGQESANESNSCDAIGTGGYAMQTCDVNRGTCTDHYWSGCTDEDPTTYCEVLQGGDANRTMALWMNYTKPVGATRKSTWQVTAQNGTWGVVKPGVYTISIPAGCFAQQPLQFRYQDHSYMHQGHCNDAGTAYSCYNGTAWQSLNNHQVGFGRPAGDQCLHYERSVLYEERLQWTIQS